MNRLDVKDLWNLTLRNPLPQDIRITVEGTVDEATEGRIVDGRSGSFVLKGNETKRLNANNIPGGGKYSWPNRKFQEAILRTGTAPSGRYTICIYVKNEEGRELGQQCFEHSIEIMSPPILLSPVDGDTIPEGQVPLFTWLPPIPPPRVAAYKIRIVEVIGRQSPNEAILRNPALFEKDEIRMTTFQYPLSARKIGNGKRIVWQISSEEAKSEIWSFVYGRNVLPEMITETMRCDSFKVEFRNTSVSDTICYKLVITNNYTGNTEVNTPAGFRISIKEDSIETIIGGETDRWRRTPAKFPPGSESVMWSSTSGTIPNGETEIGNIVFSGKSSNSIKVNYEWLNTEGDVICKDSSSIAKAYYYYQLTDKPSNYYIELPDDILNIQYVNNYASAGILDLKIIDVETQKVVEPNSKEGNDRTTDNSPTQLRNLNGLNRISVDLGDYNLRAGKPYLMTVSNAKRNYYFTYKMKGGHEK
jgi:hypothetical protein